jgi:signal transduction histidine kinase
MLEGAMRLDIDDHLYQQILDIADRSEQSVAVWLTQAVSAHELNEFQRWLVRLTSHDLRTPLATIMSSAEILRRYADRLDETRRLEHLDTIETAVRSINMLLDNVSIMQKTLTGTLAFEPVEQDVAAFCQQTLDKLNYAITPPRDLLLAVRGRPQAVCFDERLLFFALRNIVFNAVQFSTVNTPIQTTVLFAPQHVRIAVQDFGVGIPADEQGRVFDPFYQGRNADSHSGKGLGLAAVKHILELHGGSVTMESTPAAGTTVILTLPA